VCGIIGLWFGVGILLDVEVLLNFSLRVGEEGPLGADRRTEFLKSMVIVGGDRGDLSVGHRDLRVERGEFQMLLVFLRAVVAAREREDQRVVALEFAEFAQCARMIGQFVIGEMPPGTISERMIRPLSKIQSDTRVWVGAAYEHVPGSGPLQRLRVINNRSANQTSHAGMTDSGPARPSDRNFGISDPKRR
jgi:hypothetical protein